MEVLELKRSDDGHWVTIEGHHILIRDSVGHGRGFTRAALQRKLVEHHKAFGADESHITGQHRSDAGHDLIGDSKYTFYKQLPGEVKHFIEGHPEARRLFTVTNRAGDATGADALGAMGDDAYFKMAAYHATGHAGTVRDAVAFAHKSQDPEAQFLAAVHDNLPPANERAKQGAIDASKLRVGQEFTIHGNHFRVVEDDNGYRVLAGPKDFPADIPVDALSQVPVDRGSLRTPSKRRKAGDDIPFSRESLYLSAAAAIDETPRPALTLGQGLPTHVKATVGGVEREYPVSYWKKDAIAVGKYRHPVTGQTFDVDEKRIDGWVSKLKAMRAANREIPTPATHSDDPRDNMGWVIDAERVGDRLALTLQVIGDDGAIAAARNACSVKIDPNYIDETGKSWGDAIVHSAFTPVPVITGMGSFVPFAASRDRQTETPIYYLSAEERNPAMDFKALREALGAAADVPDDKLPDLAVQRLTALKTDAQTALSRAEQAETKVTTLSRTPAAPDPEILRDRMELSRSKIDLAVERGDMPPFIADKLRGKIGDAAKPNVFMLSRAEDLGDRPVDFVLSLFDGAKLNPKTGSQTGVQVLSREIPGANQQTIDQQVEAGRQQAKTYESTLPARH